MKLIKEVFLGIFQLGGIFFFLYFGSYAVELGKRKALKKLKACDLCFKKFKGFNNKE